MCELRENVYFEGARRSLLAQALSAQTIPSENRDEINLSCLEQYFGQMRSQCFYC